MSISFVVEAEGTAYAARRTGFSKSYHWKTRRQTLQAANPLHEAAQEFYDQWAIWDWFRKVLNMQPAMAEGTKVCLPANSKAYSLCYLLNRPIFRAPEGERPIWTRIVDG
jgi:hypothetical protein